jgi:hypothetical protein
MASTSNSMADCEPELPSLPPQMIDFIFDLGHKHNFNAIIECMSYFDLEPIFVPFVQRCIDLNDREFLFWIRENTSCRNRVFERAAVKAFNHGKFDKAALIFDVYNNGLPIWAIFNLMIDNKNYDALDWISRHKIDIYDDKSAINIERLLGHEKRLRTPHKWIVDHLTILNTSKTKNRVDASIYDSNYDRIKFIRTLCFQNLGGKCTNTKCVNNHVSIRDLPDDISRLVSNLCESYFRTGRCRFGDRCRWSHRIRDS